MLWLISPALTAITPRLLSCVAGPGSNGAFQSCSGLCAERARRRPLSTPWTPDTPNEYCQRFWHGARLGVCRNLVLVGRTSGLKSGHFRAGLCCVQSVQSAAPGARHVHGELPRVDDNGYGMVHTSWSALSAPRAQGPAPQKHRVLFGGARLPLGHPAEPPPRNHRVQHHWIGSEGNLRGAQILWRARADTSAPGRDGRLESGPSPQSNPGVGASAGPTTHPRSFGWGSTVGFGRKGADVAPRAAGRVSEISPRSFLRKRRFPNHVFPSVLHRPADQKSPLF